MLSSVLSASRQACPVERKSFIIRSLWPPRRIAEASILAAKARFEYSGIETTALPILVVGKASGRGTYRSFLPNGARAATRIYH